MVYLLVIAGVAFLVAIACSETAVAVFSKVVYFSTVRQFHRAMQNEDPNFWLSPGSLRFLKPMIKKFGVQPFKEMILAHKAGHYWEDHNDFIVRGLSRVDDLIMQYGPAPFAAIDKAAGDSSLLVFESALPAIKDLIRSCGTQPFVELAQMKREDCYGVFKSGLPAVEDLIGIYGMEPFVKIARGSRRQTETVFRFGIPALKDVIKNVSDLETYGLAMVDIAEASPRNASSLLTHEFPALRHLIPTYGIEPFVAIASAVKEDCSAVFGALQSVKGLINSYGIDPFVAIAVEMPKDASSIFGYGLPTVAPLINEKNDLKAYSSALAAIGQAVGKKSQSVAFQYDLLVREGLVKNLDDLNSEGRVLAGISEACGDNAPYVLKYGLPALFRASLVKDLRDLETQGRVLARIAETCGDNAPYVFEDGLAALFSTRTFVLNGFSKPEALAKELRAVLGSLEEPYIHYHSRIVTGEGGYESCEDYGDGELRDPDRSKRLGIEGLVQALETLR